MNLKWFYVIFGLLMNANAHSEQEIIAFIRLTGYNYEDVCYKAAESQWNLIKNPSDITLKSWVNTSIEYGLLKYEEEGHINDFLNQTISNPSIEYRHNLVSKPGDALLISEDKDSWITLIDFVGNIEYSKLTANYSFTSNGDLLFRQDADNLLSRSGTVDDKLKTWNNWHKILMPYTNKFSNNMRLIKKAAIANGKNNVPEYWEMLSEYENGYAIAKNKWREISILHNKIVKFVKIRLAKKYGDSIGKNELPAHLLGSLQGYDWTPLALEVIPLSSITYEIRKNLLKEELVGKNLYESASRLVNVTLKHLPEAKFFNESNFHGQCPSKLINFCDKGQMRVSTCNHPSISNYLSAHKNIAKVLVHQMSEDSNPTLHFSNRYSALEESVAELFGILSVSNSWLRALNLLNETDITERTRIVSLMITALDVLPKLAYYHSADMWRIDSINTDELKPKELIDSWWNHRSIYEGITMNTTKFPTFLDDEFIISNQPYLAKYIGTILAFQIYEFILESSEVLSSDIENIPINYDFIKMIRQGCADNWYDIVKQYLQFDEINVNPLLSYFTPLEEYIDEYRSEYDDDDDDDVSKNLARNLETSEDNFEVNYEHSIIATTDISMIKLSTSGIIVPENIMNKSLSVKKDGGHLIELNNSEKIEVTSVKSAFNSGIQADGTRAPENISTTSVINDNNDDKNITEEQTVKGTTKAIWAVSAVLIAIIVIIIIALFGRHRCRKAPKNRRYI